MMRDKTFEVNFITSAIQVFLERAGWSIKDGRWDNIGHGAKAFDTKKALDFQINLDMKSVEASSNPGPQIVRS